MNIERLLADSEHELAEHRLSRAKSVGNRPHYPMFVAVGGGVDQNTCTSIREILGAVWPTAIAHVPCYHYSVISTSEVSFARADGTSIDVSLISSDLDDVRRTKDTFSDMIPWYLYNIVDTTGFNTLDDMVEYYKALPHLKKVVSDTSRSMLLVLMDYATEKKTLCQEFLSYLASNTDYESTVIFSTRDRSGRMYEMSELYHLAADIMLFSNNDAVSAGDDEDYKDRVEMLYGGGIITASYFVKRPPHEMIARQINSCIAKALEEEIGSNESFGLTDWVKGLGFQNGKSDICEDFISGQDFSIPLEALEAFPMRFPKVLSLANVTYQEFKNNTFSDVFDRFIAHYLQEIRDSINVGACVEILRSRVVGTFPVTAFRDLTPAFVGELMGQLTQKQSNEQLPLSEYLKVRIKDYVRFDLLYPVIESMLLSMGATAKQTIADVRKFCDSLSLYADQYSFDDLGSVYETSVRNYLSSSSGKQSLRMAIAAGNSVREISEGVFKCFQNVVGSDEELFSLSFTEEWARRLNLAGTAVYKEIGAELVTDQSSRLLLPDASAVSTQKKIYALHTVDSRGDNPTSLYLYLKDAFATDPLVQFFNTGRDDCLEAFTFVSCKRERLIRNG